MNESHSESPDDSAVSRRSFLAGSAAGAAMFALPGLATPAAGASRPRRTNAGRGPRVAIFGGGVAGLTTAHELVERGFEVEVFERNTILGGKCRTLGLPGTGKLGRADLPAEHGFRIFPGFYKALTDSMQRIPRPGRGDTVFDSLRRVDELDGFGITVSTSPDSTLPIHLPTNGVDIDPKLLGDPAYLAANLARLLAFLGQLGPQLPFELADFLHKLLIYITSSWDRRYGQYDHISWWDYLDAERKSRAFQMVLIKGITEILQSTKAKDVATLSTGNIVDAFLWNFLGLGYDSRNALFAQFLDGPTGDTWIGPWVQHLTRLGVRFHTGQSLESLDMARGRIGSARVTDTAGTRRTVDADWFIVATQCDVAEPLLTTGQLLAAEPRFEYIKDLKSGWMNGMQIYLRRSPEAISTINGPADHPWSNSAILLDSQWKDDVSSRYGDGTVHAVLSMIISDWANGEGTTVVGKPAKECTRREIFEEVWATYQARFGTFEPTFRRDDAVVDWTLDPAIHWSNGDHGTVTSNTVDTWDKRPTGPTAIPNLFIAGDWIQTNINNGCMEASSDAARRVAQAVLDASGHRGTQVPNWGFYQPPALEPLKQLDADRYRRGEPNIFDTSPGQPGPLADPRQVVQDAMHRALREQH